MFTKALSCLAFVPIEYVRDCFFYLQQNVNYPGQLLTLYVYFFDTYIGHENNSPCQFPPETWNVRENVWHDYPRTNNAIEGWHNSFNSRFGPYKSSGKLFAKQLIEEEEAIQQRWLRVLSGEELRRKKQYEHMNENLKAFLEETINTHPNDYILVLTNYVSY